MIFEAVGREMFPLLALMDPSFPSACPFYDQFAPEPFEGPLDGGGVPILVVGNRSDPFTSIGESEELVTKTLNNGYLLETSHFNHVVYPGNECVNNHVHQGVDRRCLTDRAPALLRAGKSLETFARQGADNAGHEIHPIGRTCGDLVLIVTSNDRVGHRDAGILAGRGGDAQARTDQSFEELAIPVEDGGRAGMLLGPHCDPFDRMPICLVQRTLEAGRWQGFILLPV